MSYEIEQIHLSRIHFGIIHRMGTLLFTFYATSEKIGESSETIKWYNENDSRRGNKDRMKEASRMLNGFRDNLKELMIIGISKAVEDLIFEYKDTFNENVDFWKLDKFEYFHEMKILRNLNNCIKHSKGILKRGEKGNDYLIDKIGLPENVKVKSIRKIEIEDYLLKSFLFQMDVYWRSQGKENPYMKYKNDSKKIIEFLIPEFIMNKNKMENTREERDTTLIKQSN